MKYYYIIVIYPKNFREGRSPSFRLHFEGMGIGEDEKAHAYIGLNGKFKKTKCEFIENKRLALNFRNYIEPKLRKRYPSINLNLRTVKSSELDYRRKKAILEAKSNDQKILQIFTKNQIYI